MPEHLHKRKHLTSFQLIILGFAGVILIGALILTLPDSSASGVVTPYDQALYTSTSAECETGPAPPAPLFSVPCKDTNVEYKEY